MTDKFFNFTKYFDVFKCGVVEYQRLTFWSLDDVAMMQRALMLARRGATLGEIPVGAVLVHEGRILGEGYNCPISTHDATAHAEMVAIRQACQTIDNYRLPIGSTLYVTLEPCTMCFGALIHGRVSRVVYGTHEPKAGVIVSRLGLVHQDFYNHKICVQGGLLADDCGRVLSDFFRQRRLEKRQAKQQNTSQNQSKTFD